MKVLHFDTYDDFTDEIANRYDFLNDELATISVIAKYEEAKEIVRELLCTGYDVASIELHDGMYENYFDEYIISISNTDGEIKVWCEKLKNEKGYLYDESTITYIMDNCSSKVIEYCKAAFVYEVNIGEDEDSISNNENDADEDMHEFTLSSTDDNGYHSLSYYTTNLLSEDDIQDMIKKFRYAFV